MPQIEFRKTAQRSQSNLFHPHSHNTTHRPNLSLILFNSSSKFFANAVIFEQRKNYQNIRITMGTNGNNGNGGVNESILVGPRGVMRVRTLDESLNGSQSTTLSASKRSTKSNISFDKVFFREFPMVLGDNPSVSEGPPVSIGWDIQAEYDYDFHEYEEQRGERRQTFQMVIPRKGREVLLKAAGHSKQEFASSIRQNIRIKNQRKATVKGLTSSKTDEKMEEVTRKIKGIFKKKKKKIEYEHTWDPNSDSNHGSYGSAASLDELGESIADEEINDNLSDSSNEDNAEGQENELKVDGDDHNYAPIVCTEDNSQD